MRLKNSELTAYKVLSPTLKDNGFKVMQAILALMCASIATLAIPRWAGIISDAGMLGDVNLVKMGFFQLAGIVVFMGLSSAFRFYRVSWLGERVVCDVRKRLFAHLLHLPKSFYDHNHSGELLSRLTTDTTLVERVIGTSLSMALRNIIMVSGSFVMMLLISWKLTVMVLLVIPIALVPAAVLVRRYRKLSRISQEKVAESSAFASQVLSVMDVTKAYQYEESAKNRFSQVVEEGFSVSKERIFSRACFIAVMMILVLGAMLTVLCLGSIEVINNQGLSAGNLGQFFMYAMFLASSTAGLSEVWGDLMRASGAMDRIVALLQEKPQSDKGSKCVENYNIAFKDVVFSYPSREYGHVLQGLSFGAKEKKLTALVGASGAGKSTVLRLLMRYYQQKSGEITVGGVPVSELSLEYLRGLVSYVGHDAGIFPTSIRDNLCMGKEYSEFAIQKAAEKASIADFISTLPDGYETELGERGILLSEGQRQRLALARAILRDAPIVLLDEATNALDAITEEAIGHALLEAFKDKTVLVIAHRLATVVHADQIVVIHQGEVECVGTHKSLCKHSELYAKFAKIQLLT